MRTAPVAAPHAVSRRTFVVGLLALAAVILGLLTMHSMAAGPAAAVGSTAVHGGASAPAHMVESATSPASASMSAVQPDMRQAAPLNECDETCQAEMGGLLCALGLLAAGIAVVIWLVRRNAAQPARPLTWRTMPVAVLSTVMPRPPSLTELSISRT